MKRLAPPVAWQAKLALIDTLALTIPQQQELTLALMDLLVEVARQTATAPRHQKQEDPYGCQIDF